MPLTLGRSRRARRSYGALAFGLIAGLAPLPGAAAQTAKKVLTIEDYGRWQSIENSRISGDGQWVAYALRMETSGLATTGSPRGLRGPDLRPTFFPE